jgi:hypothetical protein
MTFTDTDMNFRKGRNILREGNPTAASKVFTEGIECFLDCAPHLAYRSFCNVADDNLSAALADAERALAMAPSMLEARDALCLANFALGRFEDSVSVFVYPPDEPYDDEGHYYHLLAYALCVESMVDESQTGTLTSIRRAAFAVASGFPASAFKELKETKEGHLRYMTSALAMYRLRKYKDASDFFNFTSRLFAGMLGEEGKDSMKILRSLVTMRGLSGALGDLDKAST